MGLSDSLRAVCLTPFWSVGRHTSGPFLTSTPPQKSRRVSRVTVQSLVSMPGSLTPGKFRFARLCHAKGNVAFRLQQTVGLPDEHNFEARSLSGLLPACLRLAPNITVGSPRIGIGDAADVLPSRVSTC